MFNDRVAVHGAKVYQLGVTPQEVLDYSNTLHPLGAPAGLLKAAQGQLRDLEFYPDLLAQGVGAGLARQLKMDPEWVLPVHGASEGIQLLARVGTHPPLLFLDDYGEYREELVKVGRPPDLVPMDLEKPVLRPLLELAKGREVWLSQPHNPTGALFSFGELGDLAKRAKRLVVDISLYFGAAPSLQEWLSFLQQHPNTVLLLSLTKVFCCPGLRLGLVLAHPKHLKPLKKLQNPWPLGQAEVGALTWMAQNSWPGPPPPEFLEKFTVKLSATGLVVLPGSAHYFLLKLPPRGKAKTLEKGLAAERILVRPVREHYWRLRTLGGKKDEQFLRVLKGLMQS